jgi:hypothetical protein
MSGFLRGFNPINLDLQALPAIAINDSVMIVDAAYNVLDPLAYHLDVGVHFIQLF